MMIPLLIAITIMVALALDLIKDVEFTSIITLIIVVLATIYGLHEYCFVVLAVLLKPMIYALIRKNIVKLLGFRLAIAPHVPVLMYLLSGIAFGHVAQKIIIPLLDLWASRALFTLLVFLALYLTVSPSLDTLSTPINLLSLNADVLSKVLYWLSIPAGVIITMHIVAEIGVYIVISFVLALILVYYGKRLGVLKRYVTPIAFFLSVLVLSLLVV